MMDEKQLKEEIRILKEQFGGQEDLLKLTRSLLIGLTVSDEDKKRIQTAFSNQAVRTIIRHRIYQLPTDDVPLGSMNDIWMSLDAKIQGASPDAVIQALKVRTKLVALFEKVESYLENPFQETIDLKVDLGRVENTMNFPETACDILARNMYVKSVDMVMAIVFTLTSQKDETEEETIKRIRKDSTK